MEIRQIAPADRDQALLEALLTVWEASVRATHAFLSDGEIQQIAAFVPQALREVPLLAVAYDGGTPAGFFTFVFTLGALAASLLAENLFSPGFLCSLMATAVCYLITALGRCGVYLVRGSAPLGAVLLTAAAEFLVSLPCLALVFPLFRQVHRRTTVDY